MKRTANELAALSRLLDEALELPAAQRELWIGSLVGDYAPLRDTLRSLLSQAGAPETSEFAGQQQRIVGIVKRSLQASDSEVHAGVHVGPYRLERELGNGGMGSVWLAERADQQPRRKVAVKLPHLGWSPAVGARLGRERDILASLEHPNIARLYDAGVDHLGRPYLAMEYVDGTAITDYCVANGVDLLRRLELIRSVAAAVAYAHTRLVVHRDLKPSNILVTKDGEVRLLDFGIAKLMQPDGEHEDLTKLSGRAVTLSYASPEQVSDQAVGTSSDAYSLGVVTFELLAGVRPYRLKDVVGVRPADAIMQVEALTLSRATTDPVLRKQLRGDLDAILNKALKKDPAERYQTVSEFSADIGRYLNDLPVQARPDGFGYRARKFLSRNALQVGAATLVLAAIITGTSVALWQAHQAKLEAARADQVKEFVLSIFADADTDSGASAATTAADLLSAAQVRVQTELATRPDVAVELMTAIAYGLTGQGRLEQAQALSQKSIELADRALGADHPRTIAAKIVLGEILQRVGKPVQAVALLTPVIAAARLHGTRADQVNAHRERSASYVDIGEYQLAIADAETAIAALPPLVAPTDKMLAEQTWETYANALGIARKPGAVAAAKHALDIAIDLSGGHPTPNLEDTRTTLTGTMLDEGDYLGAIAMGSLAREETRELLGPNHPLMQYLHSFLAVAKMNTGDVDGAIADYRLDLKVVDSLGPSTALRGVAHCGLGWALAAAHQEAEAAPLLADGIREFHELDQENGAIVERCESTYALLLARTGHLSEAQRLFERLRSAKSFKDDALAMHQSREAEFLSLQGRPNEAIALATAAVDKLRTSKSNVGRADANYTLGKILESDGRSADAVLPLQTALDLYDALPFPHAPNRAAAEAALIAAKRASIRQ
jgi:tetratricopeptide (TPR) repeat protein